MEYIKKDISYFSLTEIKKFLYYPVKFIYNTIQEVIIVKMSIKEYMKEKNVSRRTIYNRIEKGQLEVIKEKNKTYIIKENLNINTKNTKIDIPELKELTEMFQLIQNSNELLKNFDYSFLRDRISSIEKSLINFTMDISRANIDMKEKMNTFSQNINEKTENIQKKNNNFMENILLINEQNSNFFKESIENLQAKIENLEAKFESIESKLDEIIKKQDKKGLFR